MEWREFGLHKGDWNCVNTKNDLGHPLSLVVLVKFPALSGTSAVLGPAGFLSGSAAF